MYLKFIDFLKEEDGATIAEYAMIASILVIGMVIGIQSMNSVTTKAISNATTILPVH